MPKRATELSDLEVRRKTKPGHYAVGGVSGLLLKVRSESQRSWILRYTTGEILVSTTGKPYMKRRDIGLGSYPDITLSSARNKARELKEKIDQGVDPVAEKLAVKQARIKKANRQATFADVAEKAFEVKAQEFRNPKHASQWINTLKSYAFPFIGKMAIDDIEAADVYKVLEPIWIKKTETASRVRQRIASVFDHAQASGLRTKPNPAAWKGCLQPLLPAPEKLKKKNGKSGNHHPALPIDQMQRFMSELRKRKGDGARALEFAILTASRSGEVIGARWDEIDLKARVWRLTAERMKADKPHTVPLSDAAIQMLESMPKNGELIFQTPKGGELSSGAMLSTVKRLHEDDVAREGDGFNDPTNDRIATPHGFRSTFKDWTRQRARFPDEWSELALAHVNSDQTRAAYARNELLDERADMMNAWAEFCGGKFSDSDNVVMMRGRG